MHGKLSDETEDLRPEKRQSNWLMEPILINMF